jgi:antitoxin PrlF
MKGAFMPSATVKKKGQITIPKAVRDVLRIVPGDQVDFSVNDRGEVVIRAVTLDIANLRGFLKRRKAPVSAEAMNAAIERHHLRKP